MAITDEIEDNMSVDPILAYSNKENVVVDSQADVVIDLLLFKCCAKLNGLLRNLNDILSYFGHKSFISSVVAVSASKLTPAELADILRKISVIQEGLNSTHDEAIRMQETSNSLVDAENRTFNAVHVRGLSSLLGATKRNINQLVDWIEFIDNTNYPETEDMVDALRIAVQKVYVIAIEINGSVHNLCEAEQLSEMVTKLPEKESELNLDMTHKL